jgi:hypothetical protein
LRLSGGGDHDLVVGRISRAGRDDTETQTGANAEAQGNGCAAARETAHKNVARETTQKESVIMASWSLKLGPLTKAALSSALSSATLAQCVSYDPGQPLNAADGVTLSHFGAAISAAQAALASLSGNATRASVTIQGYRDSLPAAPAQGSGMQASRISIVCQEVW